MNDALAIFGCILLFIGLFIYTVLKPLDGSIAFTIVGFVLLAMSWFD